MLSLQVRQIGNSQGILLPKSVLAQAGLSTGNDLALNIESDGAITLRKRKVLREGWAEAAKAIADAHDDRLLLDFDNEADADWT